MKDKYDIDISVALEIFFSYEHDELSLDASKIKTRFGPLELIWFDDPAGCFNRPCEAVPIDPIKDPVVIRDGPSFPRDSNLFCRGKEYDDLPLPSVKDCDNDTHLMSINVSSSTSFMSQTPSSTIYVSNSPSFRSHNSTFIPTDASSIPPTLHVSISPSGAPTNESHSLITLIPTSKPSAMNESNSISSTSKSIELYKFATEEQKLARVLRVFLGVLSVMWLFVTWRVVVKLIR